MKPIAIVCGLGCLLASGCMRNAGLPGEVTGAYELAFTRGAGPVQQGFRIETYDSSAASTPERSRNAPAWFRRMDRNADGDVSPREFLGPLEEFRRLDADHDGLIDPKEAER